MAGITVQAKNIHEVQREVIDDLVYMGLVERDEDYNVSLTESFIVHFLVFASQDYVDLLRSGDNVRKVALEMFEKWGSIGAVAHAVSSFLIRMLAIYWTRHGLSKAEINPDYLDAIFTFSLATSLALSVGNSQLFAVLMVSVEKAWRRAEVVG